MANNIVNFKVKKLSAAVGDVFIRVTDLNRNEIFSITTPVNGPNIQLDLGGIGSVGQGVLIHGDNYTLGNEDTFKSFSGFSKIIENTSSGDELRAIDTVVIFGASIMEMSFEYPESRADFKETMASLGMNINVYERATGTLNSASMEALLPGIIEEFRDKAATTKFDIHWGGNDLANYPADAVEIEASLRRMAQAIKDAGFMIAMSNTTYRITPPYGWSSDDFNAKIQDGIVNDFADIKLDMRKLTFENQAEWFGDPASDSFDGVHPATAGRKMTRDYIAASTAPFIKNVSFTEGVALKDALIQFGSRDVMTGGLNKAVNKGNVQLYNTDYSEIPGANVFVSQSSGVNNEGRGNTSDPANDEMSVMNNAALSDSFYSDSSFPILIDLSGANINAGDNYRLQISASRFTSDTNRVAVYKLGEQELELSASLNPPQFVEMEVRGIDLLINKLEVHRAQGSSFVYISALRVTNLSA